MNVGRLGVAVAALLCGAGSVIHLAVVGEKLGAIGLGLWLASPALVLGAVQLSRRKSPSPGTARVVGLWAGALVLMAVLVASQLVVTGNRSSTAALLYLFAPIYASVLGTLSWLAFWGATAGILRLSRGGPAAQ